MFKSKRQTCVENGTILHKGRSLTRPSARQGRKAKGSAPQTAWLPKSSRSAAFCFKYQPHQIRKIARNSFVNTVFVTFCSGLSSGRHLCIITKIPPITAKVEAMICKLNLVAISRKSTACGEPVAKPATRVGFCVTGSLNQPVKFEPEDY